METGVVVFFIILFVPGLWLVFRFRQDIKQRLWFEEQRRIEHERARSTRTPARHRSPRRSAPDDVPLPVEIAPPATARTGAETAEKAASTDGSSSQRESGRDLTASKVGAAFEIFLNETTSPDEDVTPSQVDEAFEKFRG